jgi:hypothetical protein
MFEQLRHPLDHGLQWSLGAGDGEREFFAQAIAQMADERSATRQDDPELVKIRSDIRRSCLDDRAHGIDDDPDRALNRLCDLGCCHFDLLHPRP